MSRLEGSEARCLWELMLNAYIQVLRHLEQASGNSWHWLKTARCRLSFCIYIAPFALSTPHHWVQIVVIRISTSLHKFGLVSDFILISTQDRPCFNLSRLTLKLVWPLTWFWCSVGWSLLHHKPAPWKI